MVMLKRICNSVYNCLKMCSFVFVLLFGGCAALLYMCKDDFLLELHRESYQITLGQELSQEPFQGCFTEYINIYFLEGYFEKKEKCIDMNGVDVSYVSEIRMYAIPMLYSEGERNTNDGPELEIEQPEFEGDPV